MSIVEITAPSETALFDRDNSESQPADGELLARFVSENDELAFAQLVSRHAAIVMGVCRRALGSEQDAEDAFQATFLVLSRKAASVRKTASLSAWLYKTAYRIALPARAKRARRKEEALEAESMTTTDTFASIASEHEQELLDEEFNRLPEKYRLPLFLCCVEGKSRDEAAKQLGVSEGAVKGRLERARLMLRRRLVMRGLTFSATIGVLVGLEGNGRASTVVATSLIESTAQAGVQFASGNTAVGFASPGAVSLANANLQAISLAALKAVACILIALLSLAGAATMSTVSRSTHMEDVTIQTEVVDKSVPKPLAPIAGNEFGPVAGSADEVSLQANAASSEKKRCCKKQKVAQNFALAASTRDDPKRTPTLARPQREGAPALANGTDLPTHDKVQPQLVSALIVEDDR